jgi:hypothetical protein
LQEQERHCVPQWLNRQITTDALPQE